MNVLLSTCRACHLQGLQPDMMQQPLPPISYPVPQPLEQPQQPMALDATAAVAQQPQQADQQQQQQHGQQVQSSPFTI